MLAAAGYLINDYYDQKIDLINRPDRVVVGIHLRRRRALAAHMGSSILAIMIGLWIDLWLGFLIFLLLLCYGSIVTISGEYCCWGILWWP